ncbi:hypothetical protein ACIBQ0_17610 [Nocardia nova]|uniref:hypothetical protein n=1 Tax=Nocardia nova TaxID=37330 RepID=UPI00378BC982
MARNTPLLLIVAMVGIYALVSAPEFVIGTVVAAAVFVFGLRWLVSGMFGGRRGWRR